MALRTLVWFRQDLRLHDNPALYKASQKGLVMPIYILDDGTCDSFKMGAASKWWLYHSLSGLNAGLDNKLNFYQGNSKDIILDLLQNERLDAVYWNRCYEPWRIKDDAAIEAALKEREIDCKSFNASLLWEPWDIKKKDGNPYKIFTSFYHHGCLQASSPRMPLPKPENLQLIQDHKNRTSINELGLLSPLKWYSSLEPHWKIGEDGAQERLKNFLEDGLPSYKEGRDFPAHHHVSRLSPHLHFGEISPHQVWNVVQGYNAHPSLATRDIECFLRQLGWREFSYSLLYNFPDLPRKNFQKKFDAFPWQKDLTLLKAWQKGETGYPIVDAGMRELWQTGYMHNRVRMIVGSFLVKNLLIHWRHGEEWFWDCLVDADLANNSVSWQWIAGSGTDAAPYFRIFNPITQGEKFDPDGLYVRQYVPELSQLSTQYLFKPWQAPEYILKNARIDLGTTYPKPIVDLSFSRQRALEAFAHLS